MPALQKPYWSRVHREAFRQARAQVMGAAINVAVSVAGIAAAIWGLWMLGSEGAARDEGIARLFIAFVCLLWLGAQYLYWMIRVPREWDEQARVRISQLEGKLTPSLSFMWRDDDNKFLEISATKSKHQASSRTRQSPRHLKTGRVAVKNEGYSDTIEGVEVSLINYTPLGASCYTTIAKKLIALSIGAPIVSLH